MLANSNSKCYCANTLGVGSVNQTSSFPSISGCNMICKGNPNQYCGGGARLNLYMLDGSAPLPTSTVKASSSTRMASTSLTSSKDTFSTISTTLVSTVPPPPSSTPTGPITVTNLPGWTYLGCYSEATTGRALNSLLMPIPGNSNSVEACAAACIQYTFFGVEYGQECKFMLHISLRTIQKSDMSLLGYCGNVIRSGSVVQESADPNVNGCSILCA